MGEVRGFLTVPYDKIQTGGGDQVLVSYFDVTVLL